MSDETPVVDVYNMADFIVERMKNEGHSIDKETVVKVLKEEEEYLRHLGIVD